MSEIPADVMKTAQSVYAGLHANNYDADCAEYERHEDVIEIAFAIMAERERCAQIADKHAAELWPKSRKKNIIELDVAIFESAASEADSIAAAIRGTP